MCFFLWINSFLSSSKEYRDWRWRLSLWTVRERNETYLEIIKHHVQWSVCNVAISSTMDFSVLISKSLLIYEPNQLTGLPYIQSMGRDIFRKSACVRKWRNQFEGKPPWNAWATRNSYDVTTSSSVLCHQCDAHLPRLLCLEKRSELPL